MKLGDEAPDPFRLARVGLRSEVAEQLDEDVDGLEEALRAAPLVRELARRLLPRPVHLAEHVVGGEARVLEEHLVEGRARPPR